VKLTADTITDEQIRELRKDPSQESVCFCALYFAKPIGTAARARCAEILEARRKEGK
jgi:hypothetical protein